MSALLAISLFALAALAALWIYASFDTARRLTRDDGRLRLKEVVRARGLVVRLPRTEAAMNAAALAVRRCVACREHERCDRALAARDWTVLRTICPNSSYIAKLAPTPR